MFKKSSEPSNRPGFIRPANRFPGEFFALGLVVALVTQAFLGLVAAMFIVGVLGLLQVFALRHQRLGREAEQAQLKNVTTEAKMWEQRANTFMHELACFKDEVSHQDPETGLGSTRQLEVEFSRQVARYRRRSEPFTIALLQVRDPKQPDSPLDMPLIMAAAHRLAETARVEDSLCRVARRGFAVVLTDCDKNGAAAYIERVRQRFSEYPILVGGQRIDLTLSGGVAQYDPKMTDFQEVLTDAARDLHSGLLSRAARKAEPTPIRRQPIAS